MATILAPVAPSETTTLWFLDSLVEIESRRSRRAPSAVEMTVPPNDASPLHVQDEDERIHVLEGAVTFFVGNEVRHVRARDSIRIPRGRLHTHVASDRGARWIVTTDAGRFESFVRAVGRPAAAPTLPPRHGALTFREAEDVTRVALDHGIEYFGPPGMLPAEL